MTATETKPNTYTPGPWETSPDAVPEWHTQITIYAETEGRGTRVATVFETPANASLIAAAPDLLEAATEAYHELRVRCGYKPGCHAYDALNAAIAKAEGRE